MKKDSIYVSPEVKIISLTGMEVICTSYTDVVSMQDELDSDNLNW